MRVHMCTLEMRAYLCVHMWRLEINAGCLLLLLSTLSFEKGSLIELGAHGFQLDWLASELPGSPGLCLLHPVLELQMHVTSPSRYNKQFPQRAIPHPELHVFFFKGLLRIWLCESTIIILSWLIKKTHKDLLKVLKVKFCHISKFIIKLNVQKVWDCWGKKYA